MSIGIVRGELHQLQIPFRCAFSHARKTRRSSDAIVVCLESESGATGYGEALARPYVTGETQKSCFTFLETRLVPAALRLSLPSSVDAPAALFRWIHDALSDAMPPARERGVVAFNAARSAMELALVDLWLRERALPLDALIPPRRPVVRYSGVVSASSRRRALATAQAFRWLGVTSVKVKTRGVDDVSRLHAIRRVVGPRTSLRIDANGGFTIDEALDLASSLEPIGVEAFEQPTANNETNWGRLAAASNIPVMPDESLVTMADARRFLAMPFPVILNLRLAKLGGIYPTLRIAALAERRGIGYQLGCLVGETAILSAAGRAVAAHLDPLWVEGSFGTWLLRGDVSTRRVRFGFRGEAKTLSRPGLGIDVSEERLARYRTRRFVGERS